MARIILELWGGNSALTANEGVDPIDRGTAVINMRTQELGFWFWRVSKLSILVNLTFGSKFTSQIKVVDKIITDIETQPKAQSEEDQIIHRTMYFHEEISPGNISWHLRFLDSFFYVNRATTGVWKTQLSFIASTSETLGYDSSAPTLSTSNLDGGFSGLFLELNGADPVTQKSYNRTFALYRGSISEDSWEGEVIITPEEYYLWKDSSGNPYYNLNGTKHA